MDLNLLEEIITRYFNELSGSSAPWITRRLNTKSRKSEYVEARRVFIVICRANYLMTYQSIGRYLNRDHSTIMHMFKSSINLSTGDSFFKNLKLVLEQIKGGTDVLHEM